MLNVQRPRVVHFCADGCARAPVRLLRFKATLIASSLIALPVGVGILWVTDSVAGICYNSKNNDTRNRKRKFPLDTFAIARSRNHF